MSPQGHLTGPEREGSPLFSAAFLQYLAQGRGAPCVDLVVGDLVGGGQQVGRGGGRGDRRGSPTNRSSTRYRCTRASHGLVDLRGFFSAALARRR